MRPKILLDMNLSPDWAPTLENYGWPVVHWHLVVLSVVNPTINASVCNWLHSPSACVRCGLKASSA